MPFQQHLKPKSVLADNHSLLAPYSLSLFPFVSISSWNTYSISCCPNMIRFFCDTLLGGFYQNQWMVSRVVHHRNSMSSLNKASLPEYNYSHFPPHLWEHIVMIDITLRNYLDCLFDSSPLSSPTTTKIKTHMFFSSHRFKHAGWNLQQPRPLLSQSLL